MVLSSYSYYKIDMVECASSGTHFDNTTTDQIWLVLHFSRSESVETRDHFAFCLNFGLCANFFFWIIVMKFFTLEVKNCLKKQNHILWISFHIFFQSINPINIMANILDLITKICFKLFLISKYYTKYDDVVKSKLRSKMNRFHIRTL